MDEFTVKQLREIGKYFGIKLSENVSKAVLIDELKNIELTDSEYIAFKSGKKADELKRDTEIVENDAVETDLIENIDTEIKLSIDDKIKEVNSKIKQMNENLQTLNDLRTSLITEKQNEFQKNVPNLKTLLAINRG